MCEYIRDRILATVNSKLKQDFFVVAWNIFK